MPGPTHLQRIHAVGHSRLVVVPMPFFRTEFRGAESAVVGVKGRLLIIAPEDAESELLAALERIGGASR